MFRFISILLLVGGLLAAGLGGAMFLEMSAPRTASASYESSPVSIAYEGDGSPSAASADKTPVEDEEAVLAEASRSASSEAPEESERSSEAEIARAETEAFAFQPMMESMPAAPAPAFEDDAGVTPTAEQYAAAAEAVIEESAEGQAAAMAAKPSFIDSLKTVPIAHETPRAAEYKRPFDVTFAIDATGDDTAVDAMPGRGVIESGEARVSEEVEVRLSGANFSILPSSPSVQSMSPLTENVWRWSVMPLTAGDHDLVFEVFAMQDDNTVPLRTFRDTVTVKVTGLNRAIAFADQANPLFVLLGGLGSALAGLFGAIKFFGRK